MISGAPFRTPKPISGQKLLTDDNFVPAPKPESPDGYEQLVLEIAQAEEKLALMHERLAMLRARAKKKPNRMATMERVQPQQVKVRR